MEDYKSKHRYQQQQQQQKQGEEEEKEVVCEKMERYPRDLLQGFSLSGVTTVRDDNNNNNINNNLMHRHHHHVLHHHQEQQQRQHEVDNEEVDDEEVELNLGLSLGGRFGVDKNAKKKKLLRSSSVVGTMPLFREDDAVAPSAAAFPALMRTSSLPTETEEQWRRRKDMQTLRRMEAKRRRSEKQRGSREVAGAGGEVEAGGSVAMGFNKFASSAVPPPPGWGVPGKQVVLGDVLGKGKGFQGLFGQPSSQGSADSQGGSSSSLSEMDSKAFLVSQNTLTAVAMQ